MPERPDTDLDAVLQRGVVRRRRPLALLCVVPAAATGLYAIGDFLDVYPSAVPVVPSLDDLPLMAAIVSAVWLALHGGRELTGRARDAFVRWVRVMGVASVAAGEARAWVAEIRYRPTLLGHAIALGGGATALLATLALGITAFWLHRVRADKVRGWRVVSAGEIAHADRLVWYLPGDPFAPYELLVRARSVLGPAYRTKTVEVPVARIPSHFWERGLDFVLPLWRSRA